MGDLSRQLARLLGDAGCELLCQGKGSHEFWHSPLSRRTFTVPANVTSQRLANDVLK